MIQIGSVQIDTDAHEVRAGTGPVDIEPKVYEALLYLVAHRDRVISKDELLEQVWPGRVVTEDALYRVIRLCRDIFSRAGMVDPVIKTVHGVGYRFVAPVSEVGDAAPVFSGFRPLLAVIGEPQPDGLEAPDVEVVSSDSGAALLGFSTSSRALALALSFQDLEDPPCMGLHVADASGGAADGGHVRQAQSLTMALATAAAPGQVLLSASAYEFSRNHAQESDLRWLAHGAYRLKQIDEVVTLFEVARPGMSPMKPPTASDVLEPASTDDLILGWRAAAGQRVPHRSHWLLKDCLGSGGFGEAWLAQHDKTREKRVFKFCFRADRLKSLQREVTLFRLLQETLGDRDDIARILDWNFEEAPYFVESEFTADGDLVEWSEQQGGIARVPLEMRLAIVASVARALASAHAVGVLHKDVKPANILINSKDGNPRPVLSDFGIGLITDVDPLIEHSITQLGMTDALAGNLTTARTGTRRYMAPELLEGRPPTLQADIYSLGVVLFQMVVGDFDRILAPGWERGIADELLREDIAAMVDGEPARRLADAGEVARRLTNLDQRRQRRKLEAVRQDQLARERRRRKILVLAVAVAAVSSVVLSVQNYRVNQQKSLAEQEARRANEVTAFLTDLFDSADPFFKGYQAPSLREILLRGSRGIEQRLVDLPGARSDLLATIGRGLTAIGQHDDARTLLLQSVTEAQSVGDSLAEARALIELGTSYERTSALDEAEKAFQEALSLLPSPGASAPADLLLAQARTGMALLDYRRGQFESAVSLARQGAELLATRFGDEDPRVQAARVMQLSYAAEQGSGTLGNLDLEFSGLISKIESANPNHYALLLALINYGNFLANDGNYPEAIAVSGRATETARRLLGEDHAYTAQSLSKLGLNQANLHDYEAAEASLAAAVEISEKATGTSTQSIEALTLLTDLNLLQDDVSGALAFGQRAVVMAEALPQAIIGISARHRYARALERSAALEQALEYFSEAYEASRSQVGATHWQTGLLGVDFAVALARSGNPDRALPLARESLEILTALGEDHWLVAYAQGSLARVLAAAGETREAFDYLHGSYERIEVSPDTQREFTALYADLSDAVGQTELATELRKTLGAGADG